VRPLNQIFTQSCITSWDFSPEGTAVFIILGAVGIILGSAFAMSAGKFPAYRSELEQCGGGLLIAGVAFLGLAFPMI
jgi:hypothetical protein